MKRNQVEWQSGGSRSKVEGTEYIPNTQGVTDFIHARDKEFADDSDAVQPLVAYGDSYVAIFLRNNHSLKTEPKARRTVG